MRDRLHLPRIDYDQNVPRAAGLVCMALLPAILQSQSSPVLHVPVRLVVVPTLVLASDGHAITNLTEDQFELLDNNRSQKFSLDVGSSGISAVVAIQANNAMSDYLPFVAKTASVIEDLLLGANGVAAVLSYADDVKLLKAFGASADLKTSLSTLSASGRDARLLDAVQTSIELLQSQPAGRARILVLIGQAYDQGSAAILSTVTARAQAANIQVYTLVVPVAGKKFVADTFHFPNMASQKGGVAAGIELTSLIPALAHGAKSVQHTDPFSQLAGATGGTQIHFRKQSQLENALIVMGAELRSTYSLSYTPNSTEAGHHSIQVRVSVPNAVVYTRAGYEF